MARVHIPSGWLVATALAGVVVALAALPPLVGFEAGALVRQGFAPFCHQIPGRSPHVHGVPFALCHRCFGIVSGIVLGLAVGPLVPAIRTRLAFAHPLAVLALAGLPTAVDWTLGVTGVWANTPASRLVTGGVFGVAAGLLLAAAVLVSPSPTPVRDV